MGSTVHTRVWGDQSKANSFQPGSCGPSPGEGGAWTDLPASCHALLQSVHTVFKRDLFNIANVVMSFLSLKSFTSSYCFESSPGPLVGLILPPQGQGSAHTRAQCSGLWELPSGTHRHLFSFPLRAFAHTALSAQTFISFPPTYATFLLSWLIPFFSGFDCGVVSFSRPSPVHLVRVSRLFPVFQQVPLFISGQWV